MKSSSLVIQTGTENSRATEKGHAGQSEEGVLGMCGGDWELAMVGRGGARTLRLCDQVKSANYVNQGPGPVSALRTRR